MTEEAIQTVISFVDEMNEWEHKMYLLSRKESGQVINHENDRKIIPNITQDEYKNKYFDIFNKYCTERKRTYGGFPSSWSRHGQYVGINKESIISSNQITKNRIKVIAKGGEFPDNKFMFVLLLTNNKLKIDSAKTQSGDDEWSVHHL